MTKLLLPIVLVAACSGGASKPATTTPPATGPAKAAAAGDPATPGEAGGPGDSARPVPAAPDPAKIKAELLAAELAAFQKAKPVFGKYCASCHEKGGKNATSKKLAHFDITAYPFGGHHAVEVSKAVRKVLAIGGGTPTMPLNDKGAVKGDDLALIATWADAFDAAYHGGAHEGRGGGGGTP
jgi:hypothetical protein